jgi:DNA-binding transcriptional regulator YiaG
VPFCQGIPLTLKSLKPKDYAEHPRSLGQHIKKRRKELGLLQREAGVRLGVSAATVANSEKEQHTQ